MSRLACFFAVFVFVIVTLSCFAIMIHLLLYNFFTDCVRIKSHSIMGLDFCSKNYAARIWMFKYSKMSSSLSVLQQLQDFFPQGTVSYGSTFFPDLFNSHSTCICRSHQKTQTKNVSPVNKMMRYTVICSNPYQINNHLGQQGPC